MLKIKPILDTEKFESEQSSKIYDENNILITDIGQTIRTNVTYDDLPNSLVDAFVSIEDSRFFEHNGFDISRFSKALYENILARSFAQGGSTFTMQLVKNTYFTSDETGTTAASEGLNGVTRKVQEIALAIEYEQQTNKQKIFELYVNKINFGGSGNIRGIEKASEYYFNKSSTELNLSESALLAGIVNNPYSYDPFRNLDLAKNRRDTVLYQMLNHGYINELEYDLAKSIKVEDLLSETGQENQSSDPYQAYIDAVVAEAQELTGNNPYTVSMNIYTSMNRTVQSQMDAIQRGDVDDFEFPDDNIELAAVSLNNHTGEINGILGGRNYADGGALLLNHATMQKKQPGSTVKPYLDYALAFENLGWATDQVVMDKPITYRGTTKIISNSNGTYKGEVLLKDAIGWSLNIPAIETLQEVIDEKGSKYVIEYLNSLGFDDVDSEHFDTGYGIGGSTFEISVVQAAAAQAMLLNDGKYIQPHTIRKIEYNDTREPVNPSYIPQEVLSEESAYLTTELLRSNIEGPYFSSVNVLKTNYPIYVKTGTSNWGSEATQFGIPVGISKDLWMTGSTADYTTTMWYGYDKVIEDEETYFTSAKLSGNVRGKVVNHILDSVEEAYGQPSTLSKPDGITSITHILGVDPYTAPIEGMPEEFISTGLINKKFAQLVAPEEILLEEIDSDKFDVKLDAKGKLNVVFPEYPDLDKLQVASNEIDISLYSSNGNLLKEAYGTKLFDYSWVYGPVRYKLVVTVDGESQEYFYDSPSQELQLENVKPGSHIKIEGSYDYETYSRTNNTAVKEFDIEDQELTIQIPDTSSAKDSDGIKAELQKWADVYGISLNFTVSDTIGTSNGTNFEILNEKNKNIEGTSIKALQSELMDMKFTVVIQNITACPINSTFDGTECQCNQGYTKDDTGACKVIVTLSPKPEDNDTDKVDDN